MTGGAPKFQLKATIDDNKKDYVFMRTMLYFLLVLLFTIISCDEEPKTETALMELYQTEKKLNCQLESIKDSITTEWDNINQLLEKNLPENISTVEKSNMLKVRNAHLIRMFQSFDDMDREVKNSLQKTEEMDREMTIRITEIKREIQKLESEKMSLFQIINRAAGPDEVTRLMEIRNSLIAENCK